VAPGGTEYRVYVVDARSEGGGVTAQFGPLASAGVMGEVLAREGYTRGRSEVRDGEFRGV
jgi:hypothetical protein